MGFRSPGRSHNARSDKAVRTFALEKDQRTKTRFAAADEGWWALVDDLRTLPPGQIVAGIPHIGELSLL